MRSLNNVIEYLQSWRTRIRECNTEREIGHVIAFLEDIEAEHARPHLRIDIEPIEPAKITADMLPDGTIFEGVFRMDGVEESCVFTKCKGDLSGCKRFGSPTSYGPSLITVTKIIKQSEGTEPVELHKVPRTLADVDPYVLCKIDTPLAETAYVDHLGTVTYATKGRGPHRYPDVQELKDIPVQSLIGKITNCTLHGIEVQS